MQFVHVFTNAGKAIILENLNFFTTKFKNEFKNSRFLFKYYLNISFFFFLSKHQFLKLARKIFPGICNTAAREKSILN
jgi:hypothetical protein